MDYEGKFVTYGAEVQLMHNDSAGFLCAKNECSKTEQIGYRIEIETDYSHQMFFTFEPKYKSRSKGDKIQYYDMLHIRSPNNEHNLAISPSNYISPDNLFFKEDNPYIVEKIIDDFNCTKHVVYLGESEFSTW